MKRFLAFTLAETLIVMGIIGVVAALTLPNLNSSTGDKEKVAKVKKIYSNLNDALGRAVAVYGPISEWTQNDTSSDAKSKRVADRLTEFMKISKDCGKSDGCFVEWGKAFDGEERLFVRPGIYSYILADGSAISISERYIEVDIDGQNKGPNRIGYDIFVFYICWEDEYDCIKDTILPDGMDGTGNGKSGNAGSDVSYYATWIIRNDNMDYLKCSTLNWETKTSCK